MYPSWFGNLIGTKFFNFSVSILTLNLFFDAKTEHICKEGMHCFNIQLMANAICLNTNYTVLAKFRYNFDIVPFFLSYCLLIITPGGPYPMRVPVVLADRQSTLLLRCRLRCKLVLFVGCSVGCRIA